MLLEQERSSAPAVDPAFRRDVLAGLAAEPKAIPARWFYDRAGSELFERITALPEYYPTRVETALLRDVADAVADRVGAGRTVVEFGSGSSTKTPLLLRAIAPAAYVPIDISGDFLRHSTAQLQVDFPALPMVPVEADFMAPIALPGTVAGGATLGFFPGSTIGNMVPATAVDLLRRMVATLGGKRAERPPMLLIGIDRVKGEDVLVPAYDDAEGVTAAFNLNLLHRINRELGGDIPVDDFRHRAIWNDAESRIEMHLAARHDLSFTVDGRRFGMAAGDTIHTENSHKYGARDARLLLRAGGWTPVAEWTDDDGLFALVLAEATPPRDAP